LSKKPPEKLVEMGRVIAPFGIKGWIKVQPVWLDGESAASLMLYPTWWLESNGGWHEYPVEHAQVQGAAVVAKLAGCEDREAAAGYKGRVVAVAREAFPPAKKGEFYWADLIGLRVKNNEGLDFGVVQSMLETGANAVMVVRNDKQQAVESEERLIPFIAEVVKRVDAAAGVIEVEWGADY